MLGEEGQQVVGKLPSVVGQGVTLSPSGAPLSNHSEANSWKVGSSARPRCNRPGSGGLQIPRLTSARTFASSSSPSGGSSPPSAYRGVRWRRLPVGRKAKREGAPAPPFVDDDLALCCSCHGSDSAAMLAARLIAEARAFHPCGAAADRRGRKPARFRFRGAPPAGGRVDGAAKPGARMRRGEAGRVEAQPGSLACAHPDRPEPICVGVTPMARLTPRSRAQWQRRRAGSAPVDPGSTQACTRLHWHRLALLPISARLSAMCIPLVPFGFECLTDFRRKPTPQLCPHTAPAHPERRRHPKGSADRLMGGCDATNLRAGFCREHSLNPNLDHRHTMHPPVRGTLVRYHQVILREGCGG